MRPGSASRNNLTSSAGPPPGTGLRPGSGRKAPGTARLRTGIAPSGPGTQAATGIALNASVNVSDRPVTGHGMMGMRTQGATGRIVQDAAYYIGLLRAKIKDINEETIKLRTEVDQQSKDNSQYSQLERRYETLLKSKEALEGQLADYNLALDKTRSATDPEDVQQMALHMAEKNRQTSQDLDRIFMQRKQRETDTLQVEEQIENIHRNIQKRLNELEPGKLRGYNDLMFKQKELQDRLHYSENRLNEINHNIRAYESDEKNNSLRKEYLLLEKQYQSLKKDSESLQEELDIASLSDPKESHNKFVSRVNYYKQSTSNLDDKLKQLKDEFQSSKNTLEELNHSTSNSFLSSNDADQDDIAKYELLVKRDQDMSNFIDSFDDNRNNILQEQRQIQYMIVALLEHIGKGLEDTNNIPSIDVMNEMENAKQFKEKNLITAQKTMESLISEKKKREKELDMLKSSEPKLLNELNNLRENIIKMKNEIDELSDLDRLRKDFNDIKLHLSELKTSYIKRRDTMRQQIQSITVEHESLKKQLNSNDIIKELDETEKRLKHAERNIFDLKEFVDVKSRETDYEHIKVICLKLSNTLNDLNIKSISNVSGYYGAQNKW